MKISKKILSLVIVLILAVTTLVPTASAVQEEPVPDALNHFANRVVGYLPAYRMDYLDSIDFTGVTHVNLSFLTYTSGKFGFAFSDEDIQRIKEKCDANGVKLLIALGGGGGFGVNEGTLGTPAARTEFINTIMSYVDKYDLDGVDIDTEVESNTFWSIFDEFISELSGRLKADDKLLTMAVSDWFAGNIKTPTYNYFDFFNVMSYDESAGFGPVASMEFMYKEIEYFMNKGISADRLVIGVPFYGYVKNGGWGGGKTYAEIIGDNLDNRYADYSESFGGVYYNGENTIREKSEIAKDYGGVMIWELGQDSFDENSLLAIVKDVMTEGGTISDMIPVSNLKADRITASTVSFSWTAAPEAVNYNIYRGEELIGITSSTNYTVMNLEPSTNYAFKVEAVSASGVVSKKVSLGIKMPVGAASEFPAWDAKGNYTKGSRVLYNGIIYSAKWGTSGEKPDAYIYGSAWETIGTAAFDEELPIVISTDKISLKVGESTKIAAKAYPTNSYTWSSTNPSVATISNGTINAIAKGTTTITATAGNDKASCLVTVSENGEIVDPEPTASDVFVFKIDDENIYYANNNSKFVAGSAPILEDGKAIVPLRSIAAAAGISDLKYDAATKKITFTGFDGYKVEMQTGSTVCTLTKGSEVTNIDIVAPFTKDGSAMLPLRDTANLVGGYVKYENHYIVVSKDAIDDADVAGYIAAYDAK